MSPAVVDREPGWWKARIGKCADGDTDARRLSLLRVEKVGAADGAEAKPELGALITGADVLGGDAGDLVRAAEAREGGKDAAGPLLAGEAMADADDARLAVDRDPKLPAMTGSGSRSHHTAWWLHRCLIAPARHEPRSQRARSIRLSGRAARRCSLPRADTDTQAPRPGS